MSDETIVAVYDTAEHAEAAIKDLLAANVPSDAISKHAGGSVHEEQGTVTDSGRKQGFWSDMIGGEPEHDTAVYDRSMEAGSTVVSVKTPDQYVTAVTEILERHGAVDLDERANAYGMTRTGAQMGAQTTTRETIPQGQPGAAMGDEAMQLSEEQLVVGKRAVNRGNTRVRRYVVETPVEEQVTLREELVQVQRRPVQGGAVAEGAFTDKTVEFTTTGEEAVVGKSAHVYEEVAVRKESSERTETINDTVRREEVEVTKGSDGDTRRN